MGMVDMDAKLCYMVSQFKMSNSKAGPQACPIQPKFCPDYFSLTAEGIVLIFYMKDMDIKKNQQSLKFEVSDSLGDLEACPDPTHF